MKSRVYNHSHLHIPIQVDAVNGSAVVLSVASFLPTLSPESSLVTTGFSSCTPSSTTTPFSRSTSRRFFRSNEVQISACMHPHSIALRSNHGAPTGLVRKSLQPAAKASLRSAAREEAVSATMMTGDGKGRSPSSSSGDDLSAVSSWKTPMWFTLSNLRISFVASIPDMTGSWMSIYKPSVNNPGDLCASGGRLRAGYQDEMPSSLTPFLDGLFPVDGSCILQFSFPKKGFKDLGIDNVIFDDEYVDGRNQPKYRTFRRRRRS